MNKILNISPLRAVKFQISKLFFALTRPPVVVVAGRGRDDTMQMVSRTLAHHKKKARMVLFDVSIPKESKLAAFFLKNSSLPVLVMTNFGKPDPDNYFFAGDAQEVFKIESMLKSLPSKVRLVVNFDDQTLKELKDKSVLKCDTFGFGEEADFKATDIFITQDPSPGTNFKINHKGKIVPVWLRGLFGKESIYAALSVTAVGVMLGLNLVEISQTLSGHKEG